MNHHSVNNFPQYVLFFRKNTYFSLKTILKKDISYALMTIAYIFLMVLLEYFTTKHFLLL